MNMQIENPFKFYLLLGFFVLSLGTKGQITNENNESQRFIITESYLNGIDNTAYDLDRKGYFSISILDESERVFLLNDSEVYENYSYGPISNVTFSNQAATESIFKSDTLKFTWRYHNSYDEVSGKASIVLTRVFQPQETRFVLIMILPNKDALRYSGYIKSSP